MKRALITGVSGQDGTYLSQYLIGLGYEVFGLVHRTPCRVPGVIPLYGDVRDMLSLETAIQRSNPDEVYNLAGQTFVPVGWKEPNETFNINTGGLLNVMNVVLRTKSKARVYQASSSEMFGEVDGPCDENTPMNPASPYGVSKVASHYLVNVYRQKGLFVVSGILFNHESSYRGPEMVTRKITRHVARWACEGNTDPLVLGNLKNCRDWGFSGDYVRAMHAMLQMDAPEDFVIGMGEAHTVGQFVQEAIHAGELAFFSKTLVPFDVQTSLEFTRVGEIKRMLACTDKAKEKLNWKPEVSFPQLVNSMVLADIKRLETKNYDGLV